jgi:hypothetical protein
MYQKFTECDKFRFITCSRTLSSSPSWTTPHHEEEKHFFLFLVSAHDSRVGRGSVVGIATRYGLVGPGIEFRWGRYFPHPSRPALGPTQPLYNGRLGRPGVKRPGCGVDHPPPSSAEFKERVELHIYSPFGPSWPVLVRPLPVHYSKKDVLTHRPFRFALFLPVVKDAPRTATCCLSQIS